MQNENGTNPVLSPTEKSARINSLDVIRGISLLGILLMNIVGFGLYNAYMDPTINGGSEGWNLNAWLATSLFFEGTMRAMFSMLFGIGIILFTSKTNAGSGSEVTDLFFRRLWWLFLFGIIHCYLLLWNGEILYAYAIIGMFGFSFRHLPAKKLIIIASVFLALAICWEINDRWADVKLQETVIQAEAKKSKGEVLTKDESGALEAMEEKIKKNKPNAEKIKEEIDAQHQGYWDIVLHKVPENQWMQTTFLYRYDFFDVLAMMLLGMALFKMQILTAGKSMKFYGLMVLVGYSIGLTVNYWEASTLIADNFSMSAFSATFQTYHVGRLTMTLGHIGLIMLFIKLGWLMFLQRSLAAVGQMALTNYISHTIICNIFFLGFDYFGLLQRYELYYLVFSIWIFQLIVSPIWLKYYYFGPMEWVWRSLTYWKKPLFVKQG